MNLEDDAAKLLDEANRHFVYDAKTGNLLVK